jgi:hypothetical protein
MSWELIVNEKYNQDFRGHAERCTYTFSLTPEQVPGTHWSAMQVVAAHNEELASQGSDLLELKMWEDTSPTWTTDYLVEVVATASPLWWNLIIIGVLAILVVIASYSSYYFASAGPGRRCPGYSSFSLRSKEG